MSRKQKKLLIRIAAAGACLAALHFLPLDGVPVLKFLLYLIPYLTAGADILRKAFRGIRNGQVFDENFLMAVATIGAMALGEYVEGVAVMWFYQIGEFFQSWAVGKSRRNIGALMDIRPDTANVERDGAVETVDAEEVPIGTVIFVKPGERVPIDGVIVRGSTALNLSALTGESLPQDVKEGDEVPSGAVNESGLIYIRTTKLFGESTASKILELVENASSRKSRSEQFITKFARIYTPAVCCCALALAVIPPLFTLLTGIGVPAAAAGKEGAAFAWAVFSSWIYRALTFLVISCPCAIVVSVPLSFFGGIGGAGSRGILIKGSSFMETLARVDTAVFDKTGTLTHGNFSVEALHHCPCDREELLDLASHAESRSSHPISKSIAAAYGKKTDASRLISVEEISGEGVIADVLAKDGKIRRTAVGNERLMRRVGAEPIPCRSAGTIVHVAIGGAYAGHFVISDVIKESAPEAVKGLKAIGLKKLVMLTGDKEKTARAVADAVGIDEVKAELLPADKVSCLEEILENNKGRGTVAYVGDGINDAPVLTRADIGIAMGALGSDAAIEAADVVLMNDDPESLVSAIRIAKKCIRIVYENIIFAIGVKFVCLLLGALGIANMWVAIFADVGVMVICVCNAVRCLFVKKL